MKCVLALDQGTTSSRSIIFDRSGEIRAVEQQEFKQIYPHPGWVEHDPEEIWETQQRTAKAAMHHASVHCEDISAIGITNQRETTVVWNRETGELAPSIPGSSGNSPGARCISPTFPMHPARCSSTSIRWTGTTNCWKSWKSPAP
jgi:sugar (pentulose or hexulose) kinase